MRTEPRPPAFRREELFNRVAAFAVPVLLGFLGVVGAPRPERQPELLVAVGAVTVCALVGIFFVPWPRLPRWISAVPPLSYILIVFLMGEASGGPYEVFAPLLLLPLFWLALYGTRAELVVGFALAIGSLLVSDYRHGATVNALRFQFLAVMVAPVICFTTQNLMRRVHLQAAQLKALARTDALTGVPNRRAWNEELRRALSHARRHRSPLCVLLLDFDHFKAFNDTHGHQAGDELLRQAATVWKSTLRSGDFLARYGGEEFGVLLPTCSLDDAFAVGERLRASMPAGQSCSAGVASWNGEEAAEALIARVDAALYAAKRAGRDRTVASDRSPLLTIAR